LLKESTHPKAKSRHGFQGSRQQGRTGRTVRISRGRTALNVHRNRGGQQLCFLRVLARISRLSYNINWHRNRGRSWARFSGHRKSVQSVRTCTEFKGPYCHKFWAHFSRYWHVFQGIYTAGFSVQSWQNFGHKFRGQSVQHLLLGQSYSVRISGSEIEDSSEATEQEVQISLCKFLKMNML
jgi:hypothetical protein